MNGHAFVLIGVLTVGCAGKPARPPAVEVEASDDSAEALGLKVAPGFHITQFSDVTLADNIFSLALDGKGRVVVSSKGWIKRLVDRDNDGKADEAKLLAATKTGSLGLAFVDRGLYSAQDNGLWFYRLDADDNPLGPPEKVLDVNTSEHGGHILRKGPDGDLYFLAGNRAAFKPEDGSTSRTPISRSQWGGLLRMSPDRRGREVIADGLRNPYRFDFTADGEAIAYEANGEHEVALPWYLPTRLLHLSHGGHHGWLMPDWQRSFARPDDYPDAVPILSRIGEGSPTATLCYRHTHFPARYRDGLFIADWTFGRLSYVPLTRDGATYTAGPREVIVQSVGTEGFAPSDAAVAPDGSFYLSIGGRATRGAVYRLSWSAADRGRSAHEPVSPVDHVLRAPQPLEAWSRARWVPLARSVGASAFSVAARDEHRNVDERGRAIEVLVELFGGVSANTASALVVSAAPLVRRRLAWSLGRRPWTGGEALLLALARDRDPSVAAAALARSATPIARHPWAHCCWSASRTTMVAPAGPRPGQRRF